uniref:Cat eye syndrome critical region protein 2-like n=1 Tax=Neolamprologus brichardi TaxID=32507 RepID=A0A3Q4HG89_NEOBR
EELFIQWAAASPPLELEKALSEQDLDFLGDLVACLLQGCYQRTDITPQAFSSYLDDIISYRWELEEGKPNPLREGPFESLPPRTQVELLHRLCDYRLDAADVFDLLKGLDADSLRVEPLGQDGNGALYWYFYGTRMKTQVMLLFLSTTDESSAGFSFLSCAGRKRGAWSLVCDTEEQWLSLAESIKDKTSPQDRHLYRVISQNFLPEISNMIEHKVRQQRHYHQSPLHQYTTPSTRPLFLIGCRFKKKDEELDRQVLLAEQRREEERLLQEERQREKLEKIKAVEGKMVAHCQDTCDVCLLKMCVYVKKKRSSRGFDRKRIADVDVFLSSEYTIMAESLERCFSRALLKHFPSEDGDTDEEFHVSREDKERKERKRSRNSKAFGPESLIRATEQAQRKRSSQKGKSSATSEEDARLARLHPHWANGPPHPHSLPPSQQHIREGDMRGLYHPGQQTKPDVSYFIFLFSSKQRMIEPHHMGPRYPVGPDPNQQQHSYMGPTHGPCLGPRPMTLQPGAPPEASIYPSHHRPEGHTVHPMGNRFSGPEVSPQHNYPGLRPAGMPLPTMWSGMNQQGQERPSGMSIQDPNMVNQRNFSYGGIPPPVGHKPWPEAAGYPNHPSNAQFQMTAAASSPGLMSARPTAPHSDSSGRTRLASMLESPEMLALQQLSASSGPPAGAPHQHTGNFQQPGPPSRIGSIPAHPSQQLPPAPEVQLLHPARDKGPDRQPPQQTNLHPKGRADLLLLYFTSLRDRALDYSVSPLGSEGSSGTSLVSPGPMPETGTHPGGTEEGKCENQQAGGGSSINGSPAKRPHNDASEQPESPKEILDLDSHNAAAQRRSMQHPHASVAHMTSGFVYDPRALHPGMQQGVVHHMMSQARGAGNGSPYAGQPYPDPRHYAAQRPHSHLMEALQRPQQLPYSPGQTRMVMYRHPRPGGHFQGMMIQQRGVGPERFIHPGLTVLTKQHNVESDCPTNGTRTALTSLFIYRQQMMAAPSGLGSKQGL